jgi:type IV secretory pathway VirB10-like protein
VDKQDERPKLATEPRLAAEMTEEEPEHHGGGRFNRRLLVMSGVFAMVVGVVLVEGVIRSASVKTTPASSQATDVSDNAAHDKAEVDELAAGATRAPVAPSPAVAAAPVMTSQTGQTDIVHTPRTPSRYAEWAADKYMRALEAPQMVAAFHAGGTLEIGGARTGQGGTVVQDSVSSGSEANVTLHPPASPYTVMTGSIIPAVLVSGINSDLPGPILAQVSQNVFDSATGRSLLIPQGSRLVGLYRNASGYGQQRVQIAFQRLIFPDTSSMDLPQMPGGDQAGYAGVTDQVNNHYLATFGTAAMTSLISAGQAVGQMAAFGGGGSYGPYGYYQPNQWATAGETAGSGASSQMGALGQQMMGQGVNRPATIEVRPGYEFNVMLSEDLVFPGPYGVRGAADLSGNR